MKIEDIREMINQDTKINSGSLDTEVYRYSTNTQ